jgi:hypothetical protein
MNRIQETLAPLASLAIQEKYIVNGTKDDYLLPEELLNIAINVLFEQRGITIPKSKTLEDVKEAIRACDIPEGMSGHDIVFGHKPWIKVRATSKRYLSEIGFDLKAWEEHEL